MRSFVSRRVQVPAAARTHRSADLIVNTDAYNVASERYFAEYPNPDFIIGKPFTDQSNFPRYLFNIGVLFHWLRLAPGDVVAEMGAGTCWVSHFLNLYGCHTVSIDISQTALEFGRTLFERDSRTRWDLEPRFLAYDGHRFPLHDESCDRMVIHDAFHHIPNQETVLREMARILRPGGIVAMVEPGRTHSTTESSQKEMRETQVLENDIIVEDLATLAYECGFSRTTVVPISLLGTPEVPASDLMPLLQGHGLLDFWASLSRQLMHSHHILLYKGEFTPDSRHPSQMLAAIRFPDLVQPISLSARPTERLRLRCEAHNLGDSVWLPASAGERGFTQLGIHLLRGDRQPLNYDWYRSPLLEPLRPGETASFELELPPLQEPGSYILMFDLVAEHVMWFADRGSPTVEIALRIDG